MALLSALTRLLICVSISHTGMWSHTQCPFFDWRKPNDKARANLKGNYPWALGFDSRDITGYVKGELCSRWKLWWNPSELLISGKEEQCVFLEREWFIEHMLPLKKGGSVFNLHSIFLTAVCVRHFWFTLILLGARFMLVVTKCIPLMYEHRASVSGCVYARVRESLARRL